MLLDLKRRSTQSKESLFANTIFLENEVVPLNGFRIFFRTEIFCLNCAKSSLMNIDSGGVQGDLIGDFMFILYTNDMIKSSKFN